MAAACVALGFWQLDRFHQKQARSRLVHENVAAEPVSPDALLGVGRALPAGEQWRRVEAQGRYDEAHEVLVRNRPLEGSTGYYVLTPLVTDDGPALLVNRGWVPIGATARTRPEVAAAPAGEVTVIVRMRPSEPSDHKAAPLAGQVRRIDVPAIAARLPYDVYGGYGELVEQQPSPATSPTVLPEPDPAWALTSPTRSSGGCSPRSRLEVWSCSLVGEARETAPDPAIAVPAPVSG